MSPVYFWWVLSIFMSLVYFDESCFLWVLSIFYDSCLFLLSLVYFCFNIVLMALVYAAIRRELVSLLRLPFWAVSNFWDFAWSSLEMPTLLFFFPFFPAYFYSVDACVDCIVFGRSDQSFSAFFNVAFECLHRRIDAIFNARESSSSFFSWHI